MTHPLPDFESTSSQSSIQCHLCLHEITISSDLADSSAQLDWVECQTCGYHQPLKKTPGIKDVFIFGGIIVSVYIATIIAVLMNR